MPAPFDPNLLLDLHEAEPLLTRRQLALRLGISHATVSRIRATYDLTFARDYGDRRLTDTTPVDPMVAEFLRIHDSFNNSDSMISSEAGLANGTISFLRRHRIKSPRIVTMRALLQVYGYQLTIERIEE